jgi:phosphoglycerate dehydrogenase-like enzyme
MAKPRALICVDLSFENGNESIQMLENTGFEAISQYGGPSWSDEDTRDKLEGVYGIVAGGEKFNEQTLAKATDLKVVARNGVGYDKVDVDLCTERGIIVAYTPGVMADAVADEAIALVLALTRRLIKGDQVVKAGGYSISVGQDLAAMTLGLVGCGRIGAEVVRRALGFKMRVLVYDPWVEASQIEALGAEAADLDQLLAQADALTLHTPMTPENAKMVNAEFLGKMKKGAYLVNTARGGLVDEPALIAALESGHVGGAGLDCQATEPPVGVSLDLVRMEQVIAMPHSGSLTLAARQRMAVLATQAIIDAYAGNVPEFVVNKEVLERF